MGKDTMPQMPPDGVETRYVLIDGIRGDIRNHLFTTRTDAERARHAIEGVQRVAIVPLDRTFTIKPVKKPTRRKPHA